MLPDQEIAVANGTVLKVGALGFARVKLVDDQA